MGRVTDVEPMIDQCKSSKGYGKPFGVILWRGDTRRRYSDFGVALCSDLTKRQRRFVVDIQVQCEGY